MKTALKTLLAALPLLANLNGAIAGEIALQDLSTLPAADVVILGETHDNGFHHRGQAAAIRAIMPKAVVFEMLSREQAANVTPELLPDAKALEAALGWNATSWPDFELYYPVFAALKGAKVVGAARPKSQVRQAYKEGAAAVLGPEASRYGLDQTLPQAQLDVRIQEQFEAHCQAMPLGMMGGMVEAQRFRDAAFAAEVLKALANYGAPVVLIAGAGHARTDWAVPALLKQAEPEIRVLSLAFLEAPVEGGAPFDLWISTLAAEREDPCLAFK